jgi:hypothetical protein
LKNDATVTGGIPVDIILNGAMFLFRKLTEKHNNQWMQTCSETGSDLEDLKEK